MPVVYRTGTQVEIVAVGLSKWRANAEYVRHLPEGVEFATYSGRRIFLPWHSVARIQEVEDE